MNRNASSSAGSQNFAPEESRRSKTSIPSEASGATCSFQGVASEPRQETNWDRFQKFLREYLGAILELEQQNQNGIHLFAHNGTWLSFDRSARRLSHLFPEEDLTQLTLPEKKNTVMLRLTTRQTAQLKTLCGVRISTPTYIYIA